MQNVEVHRYDSPLDTQFQGWVEPDDHKWILFVDTKGHVQLFDRRDPETGEVIVDDSTRYFPYEGFPGEPTQACLDDLS